MNKDTLTGILLMGAVLFGFMWLQQPSKEQIEAQRQEQQQAEAEARQREIDAVTPVEITDADVKTLSNAIKLYGQAGDQPGQWRMANDQMALTVTADSLLSGTIAVGDTTVNVSQVIEGSLAATNPRLAADASRAFKEAITTLGSYRNFASHLSGDDSTVELRNDVLSLTLSAKGGVISDVELLDPAYKNYVNKGDTTQVHLWRKDTGSYDFVFRSDSHRFSTSEFYFTPVQESDSTVLMKLDLGNGAWWGLRYTLRPGEDYTVEMQVVQDHMDRADIIPASTSSMEMQWSQTMLRHEEGKYFEEQKSQLMYKESSDSPDDLKFSGDDSKTVKEPVKWIGFKNQFFSSVLIADKPFLSAELSSSQIKDDPEFIKQMDATAVLEYSTAKTDVATFHFYLGPNLYPVLKKADKALGGDESLDLTRLIPLGWTIVRWINTLIVIPVFTFLGQYIGNFGIIILMLTLLIKLVIFPFTYKAFKSQAKMRVLAPEIKALNERYPGNDNAMIRQQKQMELYRNAGANPMGGCLPLLLQMPFLIAMFQFFPSCFELRGEPFLWANNLAAPDVIISWKQNIPVISWLLGNHLSLFCVLMTVTNIIYSKINMQGQAQAAGTETMMKIMTYGMPLLFLFWFNNYCAGLSYYYFLSLLITILQTWAIRHWAIDEDKVRAEMAANAKKPRKKSGWMARLEEAQRQQQALLRQQQQQQKGGKGKR
jgi:YidC/Oxa1 family membrane protein insertase